jgi:hypothetical protein
VTRTRKPADGRRRGPNDGDGPWTADAAPAPPTPVAPARLLTRARELRGLVEDLTELTGCGNAWGVRVLRRNIELALLNPDTLCSPDNQLDFIEELAEALWDATDAGFRHAVQPGATAEETGRRDERRRAAIERLDEIAQGLCAEAEAWRAAAAAAEDGTEGGVRPGSSESPG